MIRERGVYLNIASPVAALTVHEWSDERWAQYLDRLRGAGINRLYFYLWQDLLSDYDAAPERKEPNRRLHERLRQVIGWAQQRKIKVVFLLAPTFFPRTLWNKVPALHAQIEYVDHGFPCICPSNEASWPLMTRLFDHEWDWFRQVDGFQLWFYDPGGCMCETCQRDLCAPLLRQVDFFSQRVWHTNPNAEFQISLWPVWAWEARLKRKYGEELLDRLKAHFGKRARQIVIVDSADGDEAFLDEAKARGFKTQAFFFSANVETPFAFFHPLPTYLQKTAAQAAQRGYTGAFLHALYPGGKELGTLIGARFLARPEAPADENLREGCRRYLGNREAADRLAPLLPAWEKLLGEGAPDPAAARELARSVEAALAGIPPERADVILASVRAVEALAGGPDADGPVRLRAVLDASPTFRGFAAQAAGEYPRLARWVRQGWNRERF